MVGFLDDGGDFGFGGDGELGFIRGAVEDGAVGGGDAVLGCGIDGVERDGGEGLADDIEFLADAGGGFSGEEVADEFVGVGGGGGFVAFVEDLFVAAEGFSFSAVEFALGEAVLLDASGFV